jgi:hypothetical protein
MKTSCLIPILAISFCLAAGSCCAKRAYMWTDENGIPHISDQEPPQGVAARSFTTERDYPEDARAVPEEQQKLEGESPGSILTKKKDAKAVDPKAASNAGADLQKGPKNRDQATLTREEWIRLSILKTSEERAERFYNGASSEEDRRQWKAELEKIKAEQKKILEVPGR